MILGRGNNFSSRSEQYEVSIEGCGHIEMFVEQTEEMCALESAMYIADVMLEETAMEGTSNMEVLVEGVVSSFFTRLGDSVKKLLAKIKQWFMNVKKYLTMMITNGKDFAKKYKTEILTAAAKARGFKYKTFGEDKAETALNEILGGASNQDSGAIFGISAKLVKDAKDKSSSDLAREYLKENVWDGKESMAEFTTAIKEEIPEREEFEDFKSGPSANDLIQVLETAGDIVKALDKLKVEIEKNLTTVIKELDGASKDGDDEDKRVYTTAVTIATGIANTSVSLCNIAKETIKKYYKDAHFILKRLISHKPRKESYEPEGFGSEDSVLEAALRMI